ncbi:hypothetical protein Tco_0845065, partial [Tanacetum coccineum]
LLDTNLNDLDLIFSKHFLHEDLPDFAYYAITLIQVEQDIAKEDVIELDGLFLRHLLGAPVKDMGKALSITWSTIPDKWNHFFIGGRFNKVLVRESGTDLEDLTKYFNVNSKLLLLQLELVCICIFNLLNGVPELMHIYFRNFNSGQESGIAGREFKNIQSDLKCGFSL